MNELILIFALAGLSAYFYGKQRESKRLLGLSQNMVKDMGTRNVVLVRKNADLEKLIHQHQIKKYVDSTK